MLRHFWSPLPCPNSFLYKDPWKFQVFILYWCSKSNITSDSKVMKKKPMLDIYDHLKTIFKSLKYKTLKISQQSIDHHTFFSSWSSRSPIMIWDGMIQIYYELLMLQCMRGFSTGRLELRVIKSIPSAISLVGLFQLSTQSSIYLSLVWLWLASHLEGSPQKTD